MKYWSKALALFNSAALILSLSACNLVKVDEKKDLEQVVATVNNVDLAKEEYLKALETYSYYYQMYGQDTTGLDTVVLDQMVQMEILKQEAVKQGLDKRTEEETTEFNKNFDEMISGYKENFKETAKTELGETASEGEINAKIDELFEADLKAQKLTVEQMKEESLVNEMLSRQQEKFYETIKVSDEEIKTWYDEEVALQKTNVEADPAAVDQANPALYMPENYKRVKHILILVEQEDKNPSAEQAQAEQPPSELEQLKTEQAEIAAQMSELILEDEKANATKIAELRTRNDELKAKINAKKEVSKKKAEDVLKKAQAGEDFEKLIKEYNEDTRMPEEGYLVGPGSTQWVEPFKEASIKLKVGELSPIVETEYGFHIIKDMKDYTMGAVPFKDIEEEAKTIVLSKKQGEEWQKKIDELMKASDIKKYPDNLADNSDNYDEEVLGADSEKQSEGE